MPEISEDSKTQTKSKQTFRLCFWCCGLKLEHITTEPHPNILRFLRKGLAKLPRLTSNLPYSCSDESKWTQCNTAGEASQPTDWANRSCLQRLGEGLFLNARLLLQRCLWDPCGPESTFWPCATYPYLPSYEEKSYRQKDKFCCHKSESYLKKDLMP